MIYEYDVFISHASEDKDGFVRPLAEELRKRGYGVWYDEFSLTLGDSLRRSIDKGLGNSKYGIVVLSPNFLEKEWPQKELDGLAAREIEGRKVILPIWHNILYEDIIKYSPTLADKLAVSTSKGLDYVVREIVKVIEPSQLESNQVDLKSQNISLTSSNQFATPEILSSDAWILLDNKLFLTELVETQVDQSLIVQIISSDSEQEAFLRNLQPGQYQKKLVSYAYQNDAAIMQVESVLSKSTRGETIFNITLRRYQQEQGNSFMETVAFNNYSAEEIAELRARFILLNELPSDNQKASKYSMLHNFIKGFNKIQPEKCVFIDLWTKLKQEPQLFLIHARLAAVYYLKMTCTVEHILELKLALTGSNSVSVQFRGQRKQFYANRQPAIIEVKGSCVLET
jgi:hypothetical protein